MPELYLPEDFLRVNQLMALEVVVLNEEHACILGFSVSGRAELSKDAFNRFQWASDVPVKIQRPSFVTPTKYLKVQILSDCDHHTLPLLESSLLYRLQNVHVILGQVEFFKICGKWLPVRFLNAVTTAGLSYNSTVPVLKEHKIKKDLKPDDFSVTALCATEKIELTSPCEFDVSRVDFGVFKIGPSTKLQVEFGDLQHVSSGRTDVEEEKENELFGLESIESLLYDCLCDFAISALCFNRSFGDLEHGILLYGLPGCGKASLLQKFGAPQRLFMETPDANLFGQIQFITLTPQVARSIMGSKKRDHKVTNAFSDWLKTQIGIKTATVSQPVVFLLPDFDRWAFDSQTGSDENEVTPSEESNSVVPQNATKDMFFEFVDALKELGGTVNRFVLATATTTDEIFNTAEGRDMFYRRLLVSLPDAHNRYKILRRQISLRLVACSTAALRGFPSDSSITSFNVKTFFERPEADDRLAHLASKLHGYTPRDLNRLVQVGFASFLSKCCRNASQVASAGDSSLVVGTLEDLCAVLAVESRSYLQINISQFTSHFDPLHWKDIGGYDRLKDLLRSIVQNRLSNAAKPDGIEARTDAALGLRVPRGILFHGPPGCSKTMFVRALATECQLPLIAIQASRIFGRYVGDSERNMRRILVQARASAPAILFIDEIDLLLPSRSSSESGASERVLGEVLTAMDGVEGQSGQVILIGATNRMDKLDSALSRAGRFDLVLEIPPPDPTARAAIVRLELTKRALLDKNLLETDWIKRFAEHDLNGYTGAEVVQVVQRAGQLARDRRQTGIDKSCMLAAQIECPPVSLQNYRSSLMTAPDHTPVAGHSNQLSALLPGCSLFYPLFLIFAFGILSYICSYHLFNTHYFVSP
ncbi:Transitional endoplasmic reticulum ATPase 1 [Clonorchis sinensis]|uniref:Transitional endoplasmic reticulum ATPase 1 n=1 Tax=Clonorchis sinensis TaxID=79923 RepID=A0A8T1MRP8_CLOSI|nr:Transitional endoplasmic reticulum ATPase 1 [Clonorchis sinensis]